MGVPQLLLDTLEELVDSDLEMFTWHLSQENLGGWTSIPRSRVHGASRMVIVTRMIESYGEEAWKVAVEVLRRMKFNGAAEELKRKHAGGQTAPSSTPSSAVTPPADPVAPAAPVSNMAQHGSVVIAPVLAGGTTGVWNVNIRN